MCNELQYFELPHAKCLDKGLGRPGLILNSFQFALLRFLCFKCSQQLPPIIQQFPMNLCFAQQPFDRQPFVNKSTDKAARLGHCHGFGQCLRRRRLISAPVKYCGIENHSLKPFVRVNLDGRLSKHWLQHRQRGRSVSECQIYFCLAKRKLMFLREYSGCLQIPLMKHSRHLHSRNLGNLCPKMLPAGGKLCFR
ncbi:hypothetical protein D3C75_776060 [compost metagenome]